MCVPIILVVYLLVINVNLQRLIESFKSFISKVSSLIWLSCEEYSWVKLLGAVILHAKNSCYLLKRCFWLVVQWLVAIVITSQNDTVFVANRLLRLVANINFCVFKRSKLFVSCQELILWDVVIIHHERRHILVKEGGKLDDFRSIWSLSHASNLMLYKLLLLKILCLILKVKSRFLS